MKSKCFLQCPRKEKINVSILLFKHSVSNIVFLAFIPELTTSFIWAILRNPYRILSTDQLFDNEYHPHGYYRPHSEGMGRVM